MRADNPFARLTAALVSLTALAALVLQARVAEGAATRVPDTPVWWWLAGYFTILTNLGVVILMAALAFGTRLSARIQGGLLLSILMVGLTYHALLARLWAPQGLAWWADQGLHSAVPLLMLGWWLGLGDKMVSLRDLPWWLIWPATYAAYALARGHSPASGPIPFSTRLTSAGRRSP